MGNVPAILTWDLGEGLAEEREVAFGVWMRAGNPGDGRADKRVIRGCGKISEVDHVRKGIRPTSFKTCPCTVRSHSGMPLME
jgi:hypothetical protein